MEQVSCFIGSTYAERPVRFCWQGQVHSVVKILSASQHPQGKEFAVENEAGESFLLEYNFSKDKWTVTPI